METISKIKMKAIRYLFFCILLLCLLLFLISMPNKVLFSQSLQPDFKFPWESGYKWYLTSGPHAWGSQPGQTGWDSKPGSGLDFVPNGSIKVLAMADGIAHTSIDNWGSGPNKNVRIDHGGGWQTWYLHLSSVAISEGQKVIQGQYIGNAGSSGATSLHLHIELLLNGNHEAWDGKTIEGWTVFKVSNFNGYLEKNGLKIITDAKHTSENLVESSNTLTSANNTQNAVQTVSSEVNIFDKIANFFINMGSVIDNFLINIKNIFIPQVNAKEQINGLSLQSTSESTGYSSQQSEQTAIESSTANETTSSETNVPKSNSLKKSCKIAFTSNRSGKHQIFVMNQDGSDVVRLTNNNADNWFPAWSPDGKKIAFTSNRDGRTQIFVMNQDGSDVINISNSTGADERPAWSPDGKKIAFTSDRDGKNEIYIMNQDGSDVVRLTNTNNNDYSEYPAWSPNGNTIAFASNHGGKWQIYIMNQVGSNLINLSNNNESDTYPTWSPDGSKIAFESDPYGKAEICIMEKDGSNKTNLTNTENLSFNKWIPDGGPSWSTDGSKIAFESDRDGNWEIYIIYIDGSVMANLSNNNADDAYPAFSPTFSSIPEATTKLIIQKANYSIGDIGPAGGLIFYINPNFKNDGWHYLEAAPSDQSTGIQWNNGSSVETGATATEVGAGKSNTKIIINIQGKGIYAAQLCNDLIQGGYSDWFLPSKDELDLMYKNLKKAGLGDFSYFYWSSSECKWPSPKGMAEYAWMQYFHDGSHGEGGKGINYIGVRAARAF